MTRPLTGNDDWCRHSIVLYADPEIKTANTRLHILWALQVVRVSLVEITYMIPGQANLLCDHVDSVHCLKNFSS